MADTRAGNVGLRMVAWKWGGLLFYCTGSATTNPVYSKLLYASNRLLLPPNSRAGRRATLFFSTPLLLGRARYASESRHRYLPTTCAMDERYSGPQCVPSDGSYRCCAFARSQDGACAQIGSYARVSAQSIPPRGARSRWYPASSPSRHIDASVSF